MISAFIILSIAFLIITFIVIMNMFNVKKAMEFIRQLIDENIEIGRTTKELFIENSNTKPFSPEKVNVAELFNLIENASGHGIKTIYLKKVFSDDTQLADAFQRLFILSSRQIGQAIAAKQFSSASTILENAHRIFESYGWRLFSTEIQDVINKLNELTDSTRSIISDSLQKMLSNHDQSAITIKLIDGINFHYLTPETAEKLRAKRAELEEQDQNVERAKINSYQKWALNKMESACEMFKKTHFFWKSDEVKSKTVTDILSSTLWTIDVDFLSSSTASTYRSIEEQILNKLGSEARIEAVGRSLRIKRMGYKEIEI